MNRTASKRQVKRPTRRSRGPLTAIGVVAGGLAFVALFVGVLVTSSGESPPVVSDDVAAPVAASALEPTGEVNEMGLPVLETPGYTSGTATAAGVAVQGADWELGRVPLNVAVRPFWTLTNTGTGTVTLGEPEAEVRAGCCPGSFVLDTKTLGPGESTILTFELAMHQGMDGWHDMGVYVPIETSSGAQPLELSVTGDFRN
ncbi:MAG: hypothetical protein ACXWYI_12400 [Actinomycetota bacterium]